MDEKLKERLFGGVILVALAIIFVPMIFDKSLPSGLDPGKGLPTAPHWALQDVEITTPEVLASADPIAWLPAAPAFTAKAWSIQVGSFSEKKNALQLQNKLLKAGYSAYTVSIEDGKRQITQVLVGPELEQDIANRMKAALQEKFALKGTIIDYNPVAG